MATTGGKEYRLAIRIAGIIDKTFTTSLATANATLKATVKSVDSDFSKLDKGFDSIMKAGGKCFSAITTAAEVAGAAVAAVSVASIAVGSNFESAFAGVKKTTEATEEEYAKLRKDILDMSRDIPSGAAEIAGVMEIGGQLGIDKDSLTDFTETMINMGVSTNLEATEAADKFARFANITNMSNYGQDGVSNYERLGSVVVDLGNNFATTEEEIVSMATNIAAAGDMAGLSQAEIMGLAATLSAVGIASEKGGTAASKILKEMQLAVEGGEEDLEDLAHVANMTAEEFASTFKSNAIGALSAFVEGLGDTDRMGQSAIATLSDLGLTEARLSDVLLRLANAQGEMSDEAVASAVAEGVFLDETSDVEFSSSLLSKAVKMANEAWDENTALAIEAGKRYETFESQCYLLKNAFEELGIGIYDGLTRTPAAEIIGEMKDAVNAFTDNDLPAWIEKINEGVPALQRRVKSAWKTLSPVLSKGLEAGKWVVQNGDYILSVFTGIGASMVAYKTASEVSHLANALMELTALNPVTQGILGVVAAVGLLTAACKSYDAYEERLANNSLAQHFGDIALSMKDIQAVVNHIVGSSSLDGVQGALSEFGKLDNFSSEMESALSELNKMNWKVSIGMELTADENEQYKQAIDSYIQAAQNYAQQTQYAVSLNIGIGLGDSAEGQDIAGKVNDFYLNSYSEMVLLGQQLSEAVNEAFADGVLDADEIDNMAGLQAKIAEVQERLAEGEFAGQLSLIEGKYGDLSNLDVESFRSLQSELNDAVQETAQTYEDSYVKNYAAIEATHKGGGMSDEDYGNALTLLKSEHLNRLKELNVQSVQTQVKAVMSSYSDVLNSNIPAIQSTIGEKLSEVMANADQYVTAQDWADAINGVMTESLDALNIDKGDQLALQKLYEYLQPQLEQLKEFAAECEEAGESVPQEIKDLIEQIYSIGSVAGDTGAIFSLIGDELSGSEEYATVISLAQETGSCIPQEVMDAMVTDENMAGIQENIDYIFESIKTGLEEGVDVTIPVTYDLAASAIIAKNAGISPKDININTYRNAQELQADIGYKIGGRATGGIVQDKELSWLAEEGPEAVIPLDGSRNALSLWEKAGQLLGMDSVIDRYASGGVSDNSTSVSYSPTLQFYGEAPSRQDLDGALELSQDKFEQMMERYWKKHARVAFGS